MRITQGKIDIRNEIIDLRVITDEAVEVVKPLLEQQKHTFTLELPEQPIYVEGDSARLIQVQENLLTNAANYSAQEEGSGCRSARRVARPCCARAITV